MKKYLTFIFVAILTICVGCSKQYDKTHTIKLIYNNDIGYTWYLENPSELRMMELIDEAKTPGAFTETKLGNPYTQTFTFRLKDPTIQSETVIFKYKHHMEKDEPHSEGEKVIVLKPSDFE